MKKYFIAALLLTCLGAPVAFAQQAATDPIGTVYRGSFRLGDRHLPLPEGEWTLSFREQNRSMVGNESVPLALVYLTQMENGKLKGSIFATTNLEPHRAGWRRTFFSTFPVCDRSNVHVSRSDRNYNIQDTECWILDHYLVTRRQGAPKIQNDFYDWSADKGRPATGLVNMYYVVKGGDLVWAAYLTNPELDGFARAEVPWETSPWHRDYVVNDPKKGAYIAKLKADGERLFELVKQGFSRPLPTSAKVN